MACAEVGAHMATMWEARVVRVLDGDTVSVTAAREGDPEIHLRLLGIDAPEKSQLYGAEATAVMKGLLSRSHVILVEATGLDKYRRTLANIYTKADHGRWRGISVNQLMVRLGAAWFGRQYSVPRPLFPLAYA